jgi:hypothetical protein
MYTKELKNPVIKKLIGKNLFGSFSDRFANQFLFENR